MKRALAAVALIAALSACSHSNEAAQPGSAAQGASPAPAASNSIDFPLYDGSSVVVSQPWRQTAGSSRSYGGNEVIAQTPATLDQLGAWIKGLAAAPPAGYQVAASGSSMESAHTRAAAMGVDFQVFTHTVDGKKRALLVIALDPQAFDAKAGPVIGMIGKYKMLPQSLRDPIDAQAKARTGFTVSDALSPSTPIGAAIDAVEKLKDSGQRGVLLIDGAKE